MGSGREWRGPSGEGWVGTVRGREKETREWVSWVKPPGEPEGREVGEHSGFEPLTPTMPLWCSTN